MINNKFANVKEFLNELYSDLTNTSTKSMTIDDLQEVIDQFHEFDLDSEKLDQLKVFVENECLFGKIDIYGEVRKVVGKVLQIVNTPDFNVKRNMFIALCQDAYDGDTKCFKTLHSQLKCLDADGSKGLLSEFLGLIPGADEIAKELKKLFN